MTFNPDDDMVFCNDLFAGQFVLVTGGGSGIGRDIALAFARAGAAGVLLTGRRRAPLDESRALLAAAAPQCRVCVTQCDNRQPDQCDAVAALALSEFGRLDVLVNNAGGQYPSPAEAITPKGFAAVVNNNLMGTWNMTRACALAAFLPQNSGRIVNIIAMIYRGFPMMMHTGAARAGVDNMTKTLAIEWANRGIKVNAIAPGIIDSSGTRDSNRYANNMLEVAQEIIPMQRVGTVREVSHMTLFLASERAASFVTGQTIYVCGGQMLSGDVFKPTAANTVMPKKAKL